MSFNVLILIIGFIILIKGADIFIDGSTSIASHLKISKLIVGLTIVAFGTSAPEFFITVKSLMSGQADIIIGNVIGSNVTNILLIIGIASIIYRISVKPSTLKKEIPFMILFSFLLVLLMYDSLFNKLKINQITRVDGIVILLFSLIFIGYLFYSQKRKTNNLKIEKPKYSVPKAILFTIVGILGIVFGAELVVNNATSLAKTLGISDRIIGLTLIAIGTSLPELITAIVAACKKEDEIIIGNVVGSNIFNIGIVIGLSSSIFGNIGPISISLIDILFFLISTVLLCLFSFGKGNKITKKEGIIFIFLYILYYILIFFI